MPIFILTVRQYGSFKRVKWSRRSYLIIYYDMTAEAFVMGVISWFLATLIDLWRRGWGEQVLGRGVNVTNWMFFHASSKLFVAGKNFACVDFTDRQDTLVVDVVGGIQDNPPYTIGQTLQAQ